MTEIICVGDILPADSIGMDTSEMTPQQRYYWKNREKALASQKAWREKNKQKLADAQRARRASMTEEQREAERERDRRRYKEKDRGKYRDELRKAERERDPIAYDRKRSDMQMRTNFHRTLEDYERVLAEQGGRCALCPKTEAEEGRRLSWDHDHACCPGRRSCGKCVRALLCTSCNYFVGKLETASFQAQIEQGMAYIKDWKST